MSRRLFSYEGYRPASRFAVRGASNRKVAIKIVLSLVFLAGCAAIVVNRTGSTSKSLFTSRRDRVEISDPTWRVPVEFQDQLVRYPNAQTEFICGPQLKSGSPLNRAAWFDHTARDMGIALGGRNPPTPPFGPMQLKGAKPTNNIIRGRLSVAKAGAVVSGIGSFFLKDVNAAGASHVNQLRIRGADGVAYPVEVKSIQSDTSLTLSEPWAYASVSETVADTYYNDGNWSNTDRYFNDNYYDLALVQYINYYRTGDSRFLNYARQTADAWWHSQWIADGTVTAGDNHLPPRSMAFAGLMLRAIDGHPEMWDYLEREVRATFDNWVRWRLNDPHLYYDIREDGYAQLYAVLLAKVLPDSYPLYGNGTLKPATGTARDGVTKRATYLSQAEETAMNFFGRLQQPDGSWRFNVNSENVVNTEQPFMVGLYLETIPLLDQLTTNSIVKASLRNQLTRACLHLYRDAYRGKETVSDMTQYHWRGMFYYWGGGTTDNPNAFQSGQGARATNGEVGMISQVRHFNSTIHHAFGYAYYLTGDTTFRTMGDDLFDASYGDAVDGLHGLANTGFGKDYAMNYRASGHYLVWRLATITK